MSESGSAGSDAARTAAILTSQLMANPNVLAAFSQELDSMVGKSSGYIESLPMSVKRRLRALKKLQAELFDLESKYYSEIHELECKYSKLYAPLFNKRRDIVNDVLEPTDSDCDWGEESNDVEADSEKKPEIENGNKEPEVDSAKGVPEFWLTIFKNVEELSTLIQDHDEPVLRSLQDVRICYTSADNMGFTVEFIFAPNEYFTNTVLTKTYSLRCKPDKDNPLVYEGPEIVSCKGCSIDWKPGKNVTERKKKSKGKNKKTVTKMVKIDSFFNFFSPPEVKEDEVVGEEVEDQLISDYEIGRLLQERIVPRAVLYFTGEALEDDEDDEEDEDEEEEGEEEGGIGDLEDKNYDEGEDPDYEPPKGMADGPPDCKQQ